MKKSTAALKSKSTTKKGPAPVKKADTKAAQVKKTDTKAAPAKKAETKAAPVKKSAQPKVPVKKASASKTLAKAASSKKKSEKKSIIPAAVEMVTPVIAETAPDVVAETTAPFVVETTAVDVAGTDAPVVVEETATPAPEPESTPVVPVAVDAAAETLPAPASKGKGKSKKEKIAPAVTAPTPEPPPAEVPKPTDGSKPAKPATVVKPLVCLLGDESLVKDFSTFFQAHSIPVIELKNLGTLKTNAKKITAAFELTLLATEEKAKNLKALDETLPAHVPVATNAVTATVLTQTHHLATRERFIGIAAFPTLTEHPLFELAPSLHTTKATLDSMEALMASAKKETALVQDGVGMVMPRILCQIINEALFTVQADVASPQEIDEAMQHGTNYPLGPIAWGEKIGFGTVAAVLDALHVYYQEERYRTAPLLRQMAVAGVFWKKESEETKNNA